MTLKPIFKSPFYRLQKKERLAQFLGFQLADIWNIINEKNTTPEKHYHLFSKKIKNKLRGIEEPRKNLKQIQTRIKELLARTETPSWLISGQKGKSIVDNAVPHLDNQFIICVDIESFYKTVSREAVNQMFLFIFKTSPDVAYLLTELSMYKDIKTDKYFIPTGSPSSQIIAFWAYSKTFTDIANYVKNEGITMTLYADDLTLSKKTRISKLVLRNIQQRFNAVGLSLKVSKIKCYGPQSNKIITGNCITKDHILMPTNKLMNEISKIVRNKKMEELNITQLRSLLGKINATRMQKPNNFPCLLHKVKKSLKEKMLKS